MALGDLFRPKHKHSDAAVRAEAVRAMSGDDAKLLADIARSDDDPQVRRIALDKLTDPDLLAELADTEPDPGVRAHARGRAVDRFLSAVMSGQGDVDGAILWLAGLGEQKPLAQLACRAPSAQHRRRALEKMSDPRALAEVVREAREQDVALGALARLEDVDVLRSLAMDLDSRDRGAAVVDRIEDDAALSALAARAKNKGVRARANKRLLARRSAAADASAARSEAAVVIEPQSWQQQQRVQLARLVEERSRGDEWVESQREVAAAEEIWQRLGPGEDADLAARFSAASRRYREQVERHAPRQAAGAGPSNGAGARAGSGEAAVKAHEPESKQDVSRVPTAAPEEPTVPVRAAIAARPAEAVVASAAELDAVTERFVARAPVERGADEDAAHHASADEHALHEAADRDPAAEDHFEVAPHEPDHDQAAHEPGHDRAHEPDHDHAHEPGAPDLAAAHGHAARAAGPVTEADRNLAALDALSADLERAVASDNLKLSTAEKKLKAADTKYPSLLVLPHGLKRKAMERFQDARRHLFIKVGELREVEDWKRWANVPKQEELIRRVEGLVESPDVGALAQQLKDAQAAWKDVGPAPREKGQELWQRFKTACDAVYDRVKVQRVSQTTEQKEHLRLKIELCVKAEELADSQDWGPAAEALKRLQAEWKTIGPVPRKQADEVWKRFRAACDRFFERRRPHVEKVLNERQANLDGKQALVKQAEALAAVAADVGGDTEVDWDAAVREVGDLRREWRRIGPVPQREYEPLNQRFMTACDAVAHHRDQARAQRKVARRGAVETICAEAEAAIDSGAEGLAEVIQRARAAVRELEGEGGGVGELRQRADALSRRAIEQHPAAFKGTDLDPDQTRKRKERLFARVAELARSRTAEPAEPAATGALTAEQMAAKLRAALAERALGGVLTRDSKPVAQIVAEARESWQRLGPLPGEAGEDLDRRFADACRRALGE